MVTELPSLKDWKQGAVTGPLSRGRSKLLGNFSEETPMRLLVNLFEKSG